MQKIKGRRWVVACLAVVGFSGLQVTRSLFADDWSAYQHDPQRSGLSTSTLDPTTLNLAWTAPQGFTEPLIVSNSVYAIKAGGFGTSPTVVDSFNLSNGSLNWSQSVNYSDGDPQLAYGGGYLAFISSVTVGSANVFSLNVLNALSGSALYSVTLPNYNVNSVTIAPDPTTQLPVAYVGQNGVYTAVKLGPTGGTTLWSTPQLAGGSTFPSVGGSLFFTASGEQYYAINRTTGAANKFYNGPASGGSGYTPVVDTSRQQFYIFGLYGNSQTPPNDLTAYSYAGGAITQLWQRTITTSGGAGTPALDANGNIYVASPTTLMKIDPATGNILNSVSGSFTAANAPIITGKYIWEFGPGGAPTSDYVYNLSDLSLDAQFETGPISVYGYQNAALTDNYFIQDFGGTAESPGFQVYSGTPEPASPTLIGVATASILLRRRRKGCVPVLFPA